MAQSKVFSGVIWASLQRFGGLAISFVSNMILARLLTPDDFGTIGMLMFFLALAQTFVDSGFGSALIQKKEIDQQDKSTVFFINMGMSVLLYLVLFACAPLIARYYGIEILTPLLRVLGLTVLIQGFTIIQSTLLMKKMDFKTLSICNLTGSIVIAVVGIGSALLGCGVWSLVYRSIAGAVITSVLLWVVAKWRPSFTFSWQSFKSLFSFGGFMLLSSLLIAVSNNVHSMILGKLFPPSTLGNFTQARTLRNLPSESISAVISQVLYPDFSKHQDDDKMVLMRLEKGVYMLSYMMAAAMLFCIVAAEPLIKLLYGGQWDAAIPFFQILCIGGVPLCLQDINIIVIKAKGKSKLLFICNCIKVVLYCVMMVVGAKLWGIYGFLAVMVVYSFLAYLAFALLATYCIGAKIWGQLLAILKSVAFALIPMLIALFSMKMIPVSSMVGKLALDMVVYCGSFVVLSCVLKAEPMEFVLSSVLKKKNCK